MGYWFLFVPTSVSQCRDQVSHICPYQGRTLGSVLGTDFDSSCNSLSGAVPIPFHNICTRENSRLAPNLIPHLPHFLFHTHDESRYILAVEKNVALTKHHFKCLKGTCGGSLRCALDEV